MSDVVRQLRSFIRTNVPIAIVKAPPGSGKTYTLVESLEAAVSSKMRVMIAAQTNNQVDEISDRIARRYPKQRVFRFSSGGYTSDHDFAVNVEVVTNKKEIPTGPCIVVATVAKLAFSAFAEPYDVLYVDEAWQMAWANFLPLRHVAERYILIGDPGQIPPTVAIEVDRWEATPFPPHAPAPDLLLGNAQLEPHRSEFQLPTCRRLPYDSVQLVNSFYDFEFGADAKPGERFIRAGRRLSKHTSGNGHIDGQVDEALRRMWSSKFPSTTTVITYPTPEGGMPLGTDTQLADAVVEVVLRLLDLQCEVSTEANQKSAPIRLEPQHIGVVSTHNSMNTAVTQRLQAAKKSLRAVRATTPERWQGLERPVMIAVHPLSGVMSPSEFDLETGRLCVMASRHQAACFILTRDHVSKTLDEHLPSASQAIGGSDVSGRGHNVHRYFLDYHSERNLIV